MQNQIYNANDNLPSDKRKSQSSFKEKNKCFFHILAPAVKAQKT